MTMNVFNQRGGMAVALLLIAVLSACGGGKQVKKFQPSNIVSFGDESSAFTQEIAGTATIKGLKYSVNALAIGKNVDKDLETALTPTNPSNTAVSGLKTLANQTTWLRTNFVDGGTFSVDANYPQQLTRILNLDTFYDLPDPTVAVKADVTYQYVYACNDNRLWIQILASSYGMSYDQSCPLDTRGRAESFAAAGAKVADVVTQIATNTAKINANTLVTVMVGQNDILAQYDALYPGSSIPAEGAISLAVAQLQTSGRQLGQAVNSIANKGARTLIMTVPDLSYSPRIGADTAKKAVMERLVRAFNDAIFASGGVRTDGHLIGVVKGFDLIREMAQNRGAYGLVDATLAACDTSKLRSIDTTQLIPAASPVSSSDLKYCNDATLVTGATAYTYLWAYDTWLGPRGHEILAGSAFARADNDTF